MRYGFIGLGELGWNLANSLIKAGFDVSVNDKDEDKAQSLQGANYVANIGKLAANCDALITCLPSPAISSAVLDKVLPAMPKGASLIEMSTVSRDDILQFAEKANAFEVNMLEVPVTGGVHLAARGEITMLVGGDEALFQRHKPAIEAMGDKVFYMGKLGNAAIIKVITNMLAFIHLKADAEALMLAKKGGLDLATAWQAIKASSGNSFVHETEGALILNGSYDVGFNMDLALKDLGFALGFGQEFGVPLELAAMTAQTYVEAKSAYGGNAQSPKIAKLLEERLGCDLRAAGFPARLE